MILSQPLTKAELPQNTNLEIKLSFVQRKPNYMRYDGTDLVEYTDETYTTVVTPVDEHLANARIYFVITK